MQGSRTNPGITVLAAVLASGMVATAGCKDRAAEIGTEDNPLVFVMTASTVRDKETSINDLHSVLEQESGLHIRMEIAPTPVRAIQLFGSDTVDAGLLAPFEFLLARKLHDVEPALQVLREGPTYRGTILVRKDAGINTLEDLTGRRIAYTDPYSLSGFVLPAAHLSRIDVDVDSVFAGGHDEAVAMLEEGRVEAAATYERRAKGELDRRGLRELALWEPVANEPVFFRSDLDEKVRGPIVRAFKAAPEDERAAAALHDLLGADGFAQVDDATYDELERLAMEAGLEVQSLVPGGWFVWHTSTEPFVPIP